VKRVTWPVAFTITFAGVPLVVILLAAATAYPAVVLPMLAGAGLFVTAERIGRRRAQIAERAAIEYPSHAALVAAALPPMPTVPIRRAIVSADAPTQPRRQYR
jgi:hypothetical protein